MPPSRVPTIPTENVSLLGRNWLLWDVSEESERALMQCVGGDALLARLLAIRGVEPGEVDSFLAPKLRTLFPDPASFVDMDAAAAELLDAIIDGRRVTVFADYDVDGGTSAAQLLRYFRHFGREVDLYVPDRILEGYGPSPEAFRRIKQAGAELVVTVDCGAAAYGALAEADHIGLPVIVIDHHLMQGEPPKALAVVNPNREDCNSGCGHLAAAGVVFTLLVAINKNARERGWEPQNGLPDVMQFLDLCALGTICDMAPLVGVNRAFVATGLQVLAQNLNVGIRALSDVAGIGTPDSAYHCGFVLGPRLNAGGRIGDPWIATRLLAEDERGRALELAEQLQGLNDARKAIEQTILEEAAAKAEAFLNEYPESGGLVLDGEGWHPGVIGIVAGRLKDRFHRPVFVIGYHEEFGIFAKGSGRSVGGVNLGAIVSTAAKRGLLASGGGHAMAAGLSIAPDGIEAFRSYFIEALRSSTGALAAAADLYIHFEIVAQSVTRTTLDVIERTGPFGAGAPEPVFLVRNVTLISKRRIGDNHLKLSFADETGRFDSFAWRHADDAIGDALVQGSTFDIVGSLKADDWQGRRGVRFDVRDVRAAGH